MEKDKIIVKYDSDKMRKMGLLLFALALVVVGLGVIMFYYRLNYRDWLYLAVFILLAGGLIFAGVNYMVRSVNPVIFSVLEGKKIVTRALKGVSKTADIVAVAGSVNFGRSKKALDGLGSLAEIAASPPLAHRTGDLIVQTTAKMLRFQYVADIFEVMEQLKEVFPDWQMMLWAGQNKEEYRYWSPEEPQAGGAEPSAKEREKSEKTE